MNKKFVGISIVFMLMIVPVTAAIATDSGDISTPVDVVESDSDVGCLDDVTHLNEGFEDGVMPPDGWEVIDTNPTKNWEIVHIDTLPDYVHSGDYAARVKNDFANEQDEWLISPEVEFAGGIVNLTFWAYSKTSPPPTTVEVHVMNDQFDDVVWDMIVNESWESYEYRQVSIDLTSYNQETAKIAWRYVGQAGMKFGLDDIMVWTGPPIIPPELEIGNITGGWAGFDKGAKVSAEIMNIAPENAEDAKDVEWSISVTGNGLLQKINESNNGTIPVIVPGGVEIVELIAGHHFVKVNITVTAYEPHWDIFVSKSVDGLFLIFFILILKEG